MRFITLLILLAYSNLASATIGGPKKVDAGIIRNGSATLTLPTSTDTLVGKATTDTLSNKTLSDSLTMTEITTPSTPAAGKRKIYPKADGFYHIDSTGTERQVGSGGGGSPDNVVALDSAWSPAKQDNVDGNASVGDWVAFADAATAAPSGDLTGGSPNTTCTRTTTSGEKLNGTASFKMTLTFGASRQGEGCAVPVYVNPSNTGKDLYFSFPFLTSGTIASGDIVLAVYDVTASALIDPTQLAYVVGTSGGALARVAVPYSATGRQLRIALYIARTTTGALTVGYDDVSLSAKVATSGYSGTNWKNDLTFTTSAGFGTVTGKNIWYRYEGDSIHVRGYFTMGTPASSVGSIDFPSGVAIDYAKSGTGQAVKVGSAESLTASGTPDTLTNNYHLFTDGSDTDSVFITLQAVSNTFRKVNVDAFGGTGNSISVDFSVPVTGRDAGITLASDPTAQTLWLSVGLASNYAVGGNAAIKYDTVDPKSTIPYSTSTGLATIPAGAGGRYQINNISFSSTAESNYVSVSTVPNRYISGNASNVIGGGSVEIDLAAGDTVGIFSGGARTMTGVASPTFLNSFSMSRIGAQSTLALDNQVYALYTGSSTTVGTSDTIAIHGTKVSDNFSAYNTSTGEFTCPNAGRYKGEFFGYGASAPSTSAGQTLMAATLYNGSTAKSLLNLLVATNSTAIIPTLHGSAETSCAVGEKLTIRVQRDAGTGSYALEPTAKLSWVLFRRMGD